MAYDEILAQRFLSCINFTENISQKRMMGGACFMVNGNMIGGADRQKTGEARFMFRVGKENQTEALSRAGAIPIVHGGRQMGGMVFVDGKNCSDQQLQDWVDLAWSFVKTLPPK